MIDAPGMCARDETARIVLWPGECNDSGCFGLPASPYT